MALRGGSGYHALCSDEAPDAIKRESDLALRPWERKLPLAIVTIKPTEKRALYSSAGSLGEGDWGRVEKTEEEMV